METRQQKAEDYAREVWGSYVDDTSDKTGAYITMTLGEITQSDYIAGYNQAIEDSNVNTLIEACQKLMKVYEEKGQLLSFNVDIVRKALGGVKLAE